MPTPPLQPMLPTLYPTTPDGIARTSPAAFARRVAGPGYLTPPHIVRLDCALSDVAAGKIKRLIISMPPRHGKSELASKFFPAWYIGLYGGKIILASYEADFASSWGRKARALIAEFGDRIFYKTLSTDSNAADRWAVQGGGEMATAGVGGAITGKGADVFIIDDPIKNSEEAHSKTYRERTWDWYRSVALTRLEPGGAMVIIATRWHEDDLTGRLLRTERDQWTVIDFPAIDAAGAALFPARYPIPELLKIKESVGSYIWSALYQQRPTPAEGGIFKRVWWGNYDHNRPPSPIDRIIQSWDCTFSDAGSSFVVGQVWGKIGANAYLLDQVRGQWDFPETVRRMLATSAKWPDTREVLIEEKANGAAVIATLKAHVPGIIAINPRESKEARASAISYIVEAGNVYLPQASARGAALMDELTAFPNAENDDQVDALTQALNRLYGRRGQSLRIAI